jgi:hypothetical protein
MPPYITEYRGGLSPLRMSGKYFSASSSHVVTCATISLTDHAPVTPGTSNCESERPVCDSWKSFQALSSRPKRWCLSTKSFTRYDAYPVCRSPEPGELRILLLNSNAAFSRNRAAERQLRSNTRYSPVRFRLHLALLRLDEEEDDGDDQHHSHQSSTARMSI